MKKTLMIPDFDKADIKMLKAKLAVANQIVIVSHPRPDGDAMGSSLALYDYLKQKKMKCSVIMPTAFPDFLSNLSGAGDIIVYEKKRDLSDKLLLRADVVFILDFNDVSRAEKMTWVLENTKAFKVMIDHHQNPKAFCNLKFSFPKIGSTCELVYNLVKHLEPKVRFNEAMAECLYTGIMTDTGSFRFSSTTGDTHRIIAELIDAGVVPNHIHELIFDNYSEKRMHLVGFCLLKKMKVLHEYNTALIALSKTDLEKHHFKQGDTEGIVNMPLSIKHVKFSVFMCEQDGKVKISFRSQGAFEVNKFASKHFNGGGHINAAGGSSNLSLLKTKQQFLKLLPLYQKQLTSSE